MISTSREISRIVKSAQATIDALSSRFAACKIPPTVHMDATPGQLMAALAIESAIPDPSVAVRSIRKSFSRAIDKATKDFAKLQDHGADLESMLDFIVGDGGIPRSLPPDLLAAARVLKSAYDSGDASAAAIVKRSRDHVQAGFDAIKRAKGRRLPAWKAAGAIAITKNSALLFDNIAKHSGADAERELLYKHKAEISRKAAARLVDRNRARIASRNYRDAKKELRNA